MAITAQDVKELREKTGCGMMDCKKALAASVKKSGRIAAEGMAYATIIDGIGVVVEINSETDFVSRNEKFIGFVKGVANTVAKEAPADLDALLECKYDGTELTVAQQRQEMVLVIGENIQVRRFARYATGTSVSYVHAGGKIGVLVNLEVTGGIDATEIGKDMAMQIAALNPRFLDKSQVTQDVLDQEKHIMLVQMDNDPKMGKFYKENCLLQQEFVKDNSMTVEQYMNSAAKALGGTVKLVDAVRFEKGEGIEKKQENFAEEIAKQLQQA